MKKIEEILYHHKFKKKNDTFYLFTENGKFIIEPEVRINERYTARNYTRIIFSTNTTSVGKIYTSHIESFEKTINRSVGEFHRLSKHNESFEMPSYSQQDLVNVV